MSYRILWPRLDNWTVVVPEVRSLEDMVTSWSNTNRHYILGSMTQCSNSNDTHVVNIFRLLNQVKRPRHNRTLNPDCVNRRRQPPEYVYHMNTDLRKHFGSDQYPVATSAMYKSI